MESKVLQKEIAVEVIFDEKQTSIIGYKSLDPKTLSKMWSNIDRGFVWVQFPDSEHLKRILYDTQILTNF